MEYLRANFSQKQQFSKPAELPSKYPQFFANKTEEEEFTQLYQEWNVRFSDLDGF
jgi:hypothetical protein